MAHTSANPLFRISPDHKIVLGTSKEPAAGSVEFASDTELAAITADWPVGRLVDLWNRLPGLTRVRKFTDRETAVRRIWRALQGLGASATAANARAPKANRPPKTARTNAPEAGGSKTDQVIALLRRPAGATLQDLMAATGWQAHSVRGFLSAQIAKKRKLRIKSFKREGVRVYRIR